MRNAIMKGLGMAAAAALLATPAAAQTPTASWRAWLGCWTAGAAPATGAVDAAAPRVCVTPTSSAEAVLVTTLAEGKVVSSQTVDASGRDLPLEAKGCTGTQSGRWSADGRRVYLRATATCDGVQRTTSGIMSITPEGEWLDVQGVVADGAENLRIARYRDAGLAGVPADIADALRGRSMSVETARVAAGADIGTAAVVEASKAAGLAVAEAFVLERGQRFRLDARELVALADAGVSPRITDAMIVVSNPQAFAVHSPASRDTVNDAVGRRVYVVLDRYSPWGWGDTSYDGRYLGYSRYDPYGYNSYRYGRGGYSYGVPVVIVRSGETTPRGRLVKGKGYEPGTNSAPTSSSAERRSSRSDDTSRSSGSGSSSSSGSTKTTETKSGGERTAKPRP